MEYLNIFDHECRWVFLSSSNPHPMVANKEEIVGKYAWEVMKMDPDCTDEKADRIREIHQRVVRAKKSPGSHTTNWNRWHYVVRCTWLGLPHAAYAMQSFEFPVELSTKLGPRQREALEAFGHTGCAEEAAQEMCISAATVHSHLQRVRRELDLNTPAMTTMACKYARALRERHDGSLRSPEIL